MMGRAFVENGRAGRPMKKWKDMITEEDRARGARGRDLKETARDRIKWRMLYYKWGRNAENSEDVIVLY